MNDYDLLSSLLFFLQTFVECLEDIRVREELAEVLTEPSHLHVAKNGRQPEVKDGVPLIAFERRASILENIHEIDEISLKDPVSEGTISSILLVMISCQSIIDDLINLHDSNSFSSMKPMTSAIINNP